METPKAFVNDVWKSAKREVSTTMGRRLSRSQAQQPQARPPGAGGLVVHATEDDGWDVIERLDSLPRRQHVVRAPDPRPTPRQPADALGSFWQAEVPQRADSRPAPYLVGGEASVEEEDAEYRRIWGLPEPPSRLSERTSAEDFGLEPLSDDGAATPSEPAPAGDEGDAGECGAALECFWRHLYAMPPRKPLGDYVAAFLAVVDERRSLRRSLLPAWDLLKRGGTESRAWTTSPCPQSSSMLL